MSMSVYQVCGHCKKKVSEKTFKEHRRLFFHDHQWISELCINQEMNEGDSRASSPLSLASSMSSESQEDVADSCVLDEGSHISLPSIEGCGDPDNSVSEEGLWQFN